MSFLQVETAKEFLSTQNVTVIGLSLFFIVILLYAIKVLWKAKEKAEIYSREQDKNNLEVFINLANHLGLVDNKINDSHDKLDEIRKLIIDSLTNKK